MEQLHQFLDYLLGTHWAYLVLFVWTMLEGETCLILAGALAIDGRPQLGWCILAAFIGSMTGDQIWFYVGRWKGAAFLAKRPVWQKKAQRVFDILHRHNTWLILGFRFLYGLRNVTPFAIGISGVRPGRFLLLNAIGAATWAVTFGLFGYYVIGLGMATFLADKKTKIYFIIVLAAVIFAIWLVRGIIKSVRLRREKRLAALQPLPPQPLPEPPQPAPTPSQPRASKE